MVYSRTRKCDHVRPPANARAGAGKWIYRSSCAGLSGQRMETSWTALVENSVVRRSTIESSTSSSWNIRKWKVVAQSLWKKTNEFRIPRVRCSLHLDAWETQSCLCVALRNLLSASLLTSQNSRWDDHFRTKSDFFFVSRPLSSLCLLGKGWRILTEFCFKKMQAETGGWKRGRCWDCPEKSYQNEKNWNSKIQSNARHNQCSTSESKEWIAAA